MNKLNQKLATIQTELKAKKSSYNSFGKYYFRKAEDILEATKPFLLKHGVTVILNEELIMTDPVPTIKSTATISDGDNAIHSDLLRKIVYEVSMLDLDKPPKNKLRKVIFKPFTRISKEEKLRIVGELIGRSKRITEDDIYNCMLEINNNNKKITIAKIAKLLSCTSRTIHRNMCVDLKREKELLNNQL